MKTSLFVVILVSAIILADLQIPINAEQGTGINVQKVSSGKIFYETFSSSGGTSFDESWNFTTSEWIIKNGKLDVTLGQAFPSDVLLTDGVWEVKTKPMDFGNGEGPELVFSSIEGLNGSQSVFEYVNGYVNRGSNLLRVIIGSDYGKITTQKSTSFSMNTGTWYTIRIAVSDSNMKCYVDGELIFDVSDSNITPFPSVFRLAGYQLNKKGCWGYWDDVKIWKSNEITITNLTQGQTVKLCDNSDNVVSVATINSDKNESTLDVSTIKFPFEGYFQVCSKDGTTLYTSITIGDIWGGDAYHISGLSVDEKPTDDQEPTDSQETDEQNTDNNQNDSRLALGTESILLMSLGIAVGFIVCGFVVWKFTRNRKVITEKQLEPKAKQRF
jgi:hypothetical protein